MFQQLVPRSPDFIYIQTLNKNSSTNSYINSYDGKHGWKIYICHVYKNISISINMGCLLKNLLTSHFSILTLPPNPLTEGRIEANRIEKFSTFSIFKNFIKTHQWEYLRTACNCCGEFGLQSPLELHQVGQYL